ncbi:MAG TPA: HEAT repeat domain-containing protein [Chloroflexia bacterium]|jgi:hypothetical protein
MADFFTASALSGVIGNSAHDWVKAQVRQFTQKSWEELYMQAFKDTTRENSKWITKRHGQGVTTLNIEELHNTLHQDLQANIDAMSFSELSEPSFKRSLANAMVNRNVLEIDGHTYTEEDYSSISLRLVEHATSRFGNLILGDVPMWGRALFAEALANVERGVQLAAFLQKELGISAETLTQMFSTLKETNAYAKSSYQMLERLVQAMLSNAMISSIDEARLTETTSAYNTWLVEGTAHFSIPGLRVTLPIDSAWIQLRAYIPDTENSDSVASAITYREWEKLANLGANDKGVFPAERVADRYRLTLLVARGGAGKSTLLRRLAYKLAISEKKILKVRLPAVAARLRSNREESIEEILIKVSASGSSMDAGDLLPALADIDYLLADGLEECGAAAGLVAQSLADWARGHVKARIIATTRYTGYDPSLLQGWTVVTLLPLNKDEIRGHAKQILAALYEDQTAADKKLALFEKRLATHEYAAFMACNPLLLGFLIALFTQEVPFGERTYDLYERIVQLAYRGLMQDREAPTEIDETTAMHILYTSGWYLLQEQLLARTELLELIGCELEQALSLTKLQAKRQAEEGLRFWEQRRILETLSGLVSDSVVFTHPALAEYAAGQYAVSLDRQALRRWIAQVWADPKWHDAILVASAAGANNELAAFLLEPEAKDPLFSIKPHLASEVLAEAKSPSNEQVEGVVVLLSNQLQSGIPLLAYQAVNAAVRLSAHSPQLLGQLAQTMSRSDQPWTRLAGLRLAIACGVDYVDMDALEMVLDTDYTQLRPGPFGMHLDSSGGWQVWNNVLAEGLPLLIERKPGQGTFDRVRRVIEKSNYTSKTQSTLTRLVSTKPGYEIVAEGFSSKIQDMFKSILEWGADARSQWPKAEQAILEAILEVATPKGTNVDDLLAHTSKPEEYNNLGSLIDGMGFVEAESDAWFVLTERDEAAAMHTVLQGVIAALDIDPDKLAVEARWALEESRTADGFRIILASLPPFRGTADWLKAKQLALPAAELVRALNHPSAVIATNAAHILNASIDQPEAAVLAKEVLASGGKDALYALSQCVAGLWGEDALEIVLTRLNTEPLPGTEALLFCLPELSGTSTDDRVFTVLLKSLTSPRSVVSLVAADLLSQYDSAILVQHIETLRDAFAHWTEQGVPCERHKDPIIVKKSSCPKCGLVLHNPREKLLTILVGLKGCTYDELVTLCNDPHDEVRRKAQSAIVEMAVASEGAELIADIVQRIKADTLPFGVLHALLEIPVERLAPLKAKLLALLNSPSPYVRSRVLNSLTRRWMGRNEAIEYAQRALEDESPDIRDTAARVLRIIL